MLKDTWNGPFPWDKDMDMGMDRKTEGWRGKSRIWGGAERRDGKLGQDLRTKRYFQSLSLLLSVPGK